ncbi:hypothetical protein KSP39_PZI005292 [Platanthera zijinensis]|uniref:starch synthase n=1 Tax=Platanthera zijinensis TaxID=2320716 RepID=A0AAP0BQX0_9ASPA
MEEVSSHTLPLPITPLYSIPSRTLHDEAHILGELSQGELPHKELKLQVYSRRSKAPNTQTHPMLPAPVPTPSKESSKPLIALRKGDDVEEVRIEGEFGKTRKYILDLLEQFGMSGCRLADIPKEVNHNLGKNDGDPIEDVIGYQRLVGRLIYLSHTRPDIAYIVGVVSQYMHSLKTRHLDAAHRILRYLKTSPGRGILFTPNADMKIEGYTDADWGGSIEDRRSTSWYCLFVSENLVTWRSKKQSVVSRSSAEAKFRAMTHGNCEGLWIHSLMYDLGLSESSPIRLYCDNKAAISIANNPVQHDRTKHIEVDRHFIKENFEKKIILFICISFVPSEGQLADILTKSLGGILSVFVSTNWVGGLGDVVSGLSKSLQRRGHLVEIVLPKYDCLQYDQISGLKALDVAIESFFDGQLFKNNIWVGIVEGLPVFFIEPQHPSMFFHRGSFYGEHDDFKRFSFFSRAALELLYQAGKKPDIIHCHDWQTAFVAPLYWDIYAAKGFNSARICFTCHNFEYQGAAHVSELSSCGLDIQRLDRPDRMQDNLASDRINPLKGAIVFSNIVTTVSPTYAQEVLTPEGGPLVTEYFAEWKVFVDEIKDPWEIPTTREEC